MIATALAMVLGLPGLHAVEHLLEPSSHDHGAATTTVRRRTAVPATRDAHAARAHGHAHGNARRPGLAHGLGPGRVATSAPEHAHAGGAVAHRHERPERRPHSHGDQPPAGQRDAGQHLGFLFAWAPASLLIPAVTLAPALSSASMPTRPRRAVERVRDHGVRGPPSVA